MDDYLSKPLQQDKLEAALTRARNGLRHSFLKTCPDVIAPDPRRNRKASIGARPCHNAVEPRDSPRHGDEHS